MITRFNENQIVVNLMGQACGDVQIFARNCFIGTAVVNSCLRRLNEDGEPPFEILANLARHQNESHYSWHLTAVGAQFILENLQGVYSARITARLEAIANGKVGG